MPRSSRQTLPSRSRLPTCSRAAPSCSPTSQDSRHGARRGIRLRCSCCWEESIPPSTKWHDGARYSRYGTTQSETRFPQSHLVDLLTLSRRRSKPLATRTLPSRASPTRSPITHGSWLSSLSTAGTKCAKSRASSSGRSVQKRETWTCDSACTRVRSPQGFLLESVLASNSLGILVCVPVVTSIGKRHMASFLSPY